MTRPKESKDEVIEQLEEENKTLREENQWLQSTVDDYESRFSEIKSSLPDSDQNEDDEQG